MKAFVKEVNLSGVKITMAVLFGSMVKGNFHKDSDIDLALWTDEFCGSVSFDIAKMMKVKRNFPSLELHTFELEDTETNNPFVEEIMKFGIVL